MPEEPVWISVAAAAHRAGASKDTIRRHIAEGTIPAYRLGRLIRIKVSDLDAALRPVR